MVSCESCPFVHKVEPLYGLVCQESARSSSRVFLVFLTSFILDIALPTSAMRSQYTSSNGLGELTQIKTAFGLRVCLVAFASGQAFSRCDAFKPLSDGRP